MQQPIAAATSTFVRILCFLLEHWHWVSYKIRLGFRACRDGWHLVRKTWHKHSQCIRTAGITIFLLAIFGLATWGSVRYGQSSAQKATAECRSRFGPPGTLGFQGAPDFYGLGIRVGLYLQWVACLVTSGFLFEERRNVVVTYVIFSLSIAVATLVSVFGRQCLFTAEVEIILTLFWGGINVVQLPLIRAHSRTTQSYSTPKASSKWLIWSSHLLNFLVSPITIWYWARLAAVGEQDFAPTPGGTTLFFFGQEQEAGLWRFSILMAGWSCMNFLWLVWTFNPLPFSDNRHGWPKCRAVVLALTFPLYLLYQSLATLCMMAAALFAKGLAFSSFRDIYAAITQKKPSFDPDKEKRVKLLIRLELLFPLLIGIWCIFAVELTLHWNNVTGVYTIDSTGQIIPFVIGVTNIVVTTRNAVMKTYRRKRQRKLESEGGLSSEVQGEEQGAVDLESGRHALDRRPTQGMHTAIERNIRNASITWFGLYGTIFLNNHAAIR